MLTKTLHLGLHATSATTNFGTTAARAGAATEVAEGRKHQHYQEINKRYHSQPTAIETSVAIGHVIVPF